MDTYQQALVMLREVGNQADEETTLKDIGGVYYNQGHCAKALGSYQQALAIERKVGDRAGEAGGDGGPCATCATPSMWARRRSCSASRRISQCRPSGRFDMGENGRLAGCPL